MIIRSVFSLSQSKQPASSSKMRSSIICSESKSVPRHLFEFTVFSQFQKKLPRTANRPLKSRSCPSFFVYQSRENICLSLEI